MTHHSNKAASSNGRNRTPKAKGDTCGHGIRNTILASHEGAIWTTSLRGPLVKKASQRKEYDPRQRNDDAAKHEANGADGDRLSSRKASQCHRREAGPGGCRIGLGGPVGDKVNLAPGPLFGWQWIEVAIGPASFSSTAVDDKGRLGNVRVGEVLFPSMGHCLC